MKLIVQVANLAPLQLKFKYLQRAAAAGLTQGVDEAALLFETEAKNLAPVDTGRLRDSIHTELTEDTPVRQTREIKPDTPYAHRLEYGFVGTDSLGRHYNQAAQPYMRPAFDSQKDEAEKRVRESLMDAMDVAAMRRR